MKRRERGVLTGTRWLGGQQLMTLEELKKRQVTHPSTPTQLEDTRALDPGRAPETSVCSQFARTAIPPAAFYASVPRQHTSGTKTRGEVAAGTYNKPIHGHLYGSSSLFLPPLSFLHPLPVQQVLRQ